MGSKIWLCMIKHKNNTPPSEAGGLLMVVSMVLLAAFQVFWLRKEYNEQKSILQKETDILFRNTIQTLEDSVIAKKISLPIRKMLPPDSQISLQKKKVVNPKLAFHYTQNSTYSESKVVDSRNEDAQKIAPSEAFNLFYAKTAARLSQVSGIDTALTYKDKFLEVLRKTKQDDIQRVKFN